jgi:hypothetical protein
VETDIVSPSVGATLCRSVMTTSPEGSRGPVKGASGPAGPRQKFTNGGAVSFVKFWTLYGDEPRRH